LVSGGLIAFLIIKVSPQKIFLHLKDIDPLVLAGAFFVFFASSLLGALQWHILLRAGGIGLNFRQTFKLYFVGLFFNNFLPANVGGDAIKIYDVARGGNDPYQVFAITLLDRVIGITGLSLLALFASVALFFNGGFFNLHVYFAIFLLCVIPFFALATTKSLSGFIRRMLGRISLWGIGGKFNQVFDHLSEFKKLRVLLIKVLALSLLVQSLRIATHVVVAYALNIDVSPSNYIHFFIFIPLLGLIMILPISINGLGVREGTGILLFTQIGFSNEQALLMEFITYFVMVVVSLVGGAFFLKRHIVTGADSGISRNEERMRE